MRKTADETSRNEGKKIMEGRVWVLIFCQQGLSVTMVTRQKDDVITSKGCFVWWGYFGGLAKQFIVSFSNIRKNTGAAVNKELKLISKLLFFGSVFQHR